MPNNAEFASKQLSLNNQRQVIEGQTGTKDADIDASEAWGLTIGNSTLIAAVLDSGIDYNHDLVADRWTNPGKPPEASFYAPYVDPLFADYDPSYMGPYD